MTPSTHRNHSISQPPPPTRASQAIETATRHSLESYHLPDDAHLLPFPTPCFSYYINSRMQLLYTDRDQTQRHHRIFSLAASQLPRQELRADGLLLDNAACELAQSYARVITLYENWSSHILEAGAQRITLWSQWHSTHLHPPYLHSPAFIHAVEPTLTFLEEDHEKRKLDFVTEIYALLHQKDPENASMVLRDLWEIWPGVQINQVEVLEGYVVDYAHVPRRRGFVRRGEDWGRLKE